MMTKSPSARKKHSSKESPAKATKNQNHIILVASESQGLYTTQRLLLEAEKLHYKAKWFNPYESLLILKEHYSTIPLVGRYFVRTSGTKYDDIDLTIARHFMDSGLHVTNPLSALDDFRSKDRQALFFKRHNLPSVPSLLYRGGLNDLYWNEIEAISKNRQYVLKMIRGNQGTGVNLISGSQSLKSILETFHALKDQKFLIQPYIDHKKEYRLFMIKNSIIGAIEKTLTPDDFRGNSKRSKGKFLKNIPSQMAELALKAQAVSGLDYCGIDVMETKKGLVVLEINAVPGFEQMEELSGLNIARELLTQI